MATRNRREIQMARQPRSGALGRAPNLEWVPGGHRRAADGEYRAIKARDDLRVGKGSTAPLVERQAACKQEDELLYTSYFILYRYRYGAASRRTSGGRPWSLHPILGRLGEGGGGMCACVGAWVCGRV